MNDIIVKNNRNDYNNEKIVSKILIFVFRYIQNLNKMLIDIKRSTIIIFIQKFQFYICNIKIVNFICDKTNRHFDNLNIIKITK